MPFNLEKQRFLRLGSPLRVPCKCLNLALKYAYGSELLPYPSPVSSLTLAQLILRTIWLELEVRQEGCAVWGC